MAAGWLIKKIMEAVSIKPPPGYSTGRIAIAGVAAAAYAAGDALGTQFRIDVPKGSILQSATYWDLSDLNVQVNVVISRTPFATAIADNAAFDVPNIDELKIDYELQFVVFNDHITSRSSYIDQIGRVLRFPEGACYLQAWTVAAQTPVVNRLPQIQLDFLPDE